MKKEIIKRYLLVLGGGLILFGIVSLCQPFTFFLYHYGFAFLGGGTALYITVTHLK